MCYGCKLELGYIHTVATLTGYLRLIHTYTYTACFLTNETGLFRSCFTGAESAGKLLTAHNIRNQNHGYETYLPSTLDEMETYWRLHFGFHIFATPASASPSASVPVTKATATANATGIAASTMVLVELEMSYGPRVFPLPVLAL